MWFSWVYLVLLVFYMVFRGLPSFIGFRRQFPRVSGKTGKKSFVEMETSSPFSFSFVLPFNVSIDFSLIFFDELARTFHFVCVCVCVCVSLWNQPWLLLEETNRFSFAAPWWRKSEGPFYIY